ncbi:MAG: universal stress protein [Nocardioidaceae bacterium]
MTSLEHGSVVVGVDGSTSSDAAVTWAAHHAAARHLPLLLVHGAGELHSGSELLGPSETTEELRTVARGVTDRAMAVLDALGLTLDIEVSSPLRDPREALLDCASEASILVVGTRGLGPLRMLLLGAVSSAVAAHATCPVAVVRTPHGLKGSAARHVVVGTDGAPVTAAALEFAFDLASFEGRSLDVVHSWADHDTFVDLGSYEERLQQEGDHERMLGEALAGYGEKFPDVVVVRHLPEASATETLLALSTDAFAVVVGTRGRTGVRALLTSVSRDIVERAACTAIVVRA